MEETVPNNKSGYGKRPLWQWLTIYIVIGAVVYGAIYYFVLGKKNGYNYNQSLQQYSQPTAKVSPSSAMMNKEITVVLKPVNNSDELGSAILKEENGQTKVTISLTGYTKDVEQPAHIHIGVCPGVGSVKYPLTSIVNGTSVTILTVTLDQLKKELPLAINVHKSKTEIASYTACGPLNFK